MKTLKDYIVNENNFFKNLGVGQEVLIKKWLDEHKIKNYTINDDLTIDINGSINLRRCGVEQLPEYIQFGKVSGYFVCCGCKLKSLEGCPQKVGYQFDCSECNSLETLKGCPKEVGDYFYCYSCPELTSLEDCPKEVGGDFYCSCCPKLTSLKGCPEKVGGSFECSGCTKLESLKGCPKVVDKDFDCECCGTQFSEYDVKKYCKVKGEINV
jgi:hypothetical protein